MLFERAAWTCQHKIHQEETMWKPEERLDLAEVACSKWPKKEAAKGHEGPTGVAPKGIEVQPLRALVAAPAVTTFPEVPRVSSLQHLSCSSLEEGAN